MSKKKERVTAGNKVKRYIPHDTKGRCPFCHNTVKALKEHIRSKHKGKKLPKKRK